MNKLVQWIVGMAINLGIWTACWAVHYGWFTSA